MKANAVSWRENDCIVCCALRGDLWDVEVRRASDGEILAYATSLRSRGEAINVGKLSIEARALAARESWTPHDLP